LHYKFLLRICILTLKSKFAKRIEKGSIHPPLLNLGQILTLTGALPLIEVLRLADSDQKPAMGFIYESMDQAKEKIQKSFNVVKKRYFG